MSPSGAPTTTTLPSRTAQSPQMIGPPRPASSATWSGACPGASRMRARSSPSGIAVPGVNVRSVGIAPRRVAKPVVRPSSRAQTVASVSAAYVSTAHRRGRDGCETRRCSTDRSRTARSRASVRAAGSTRTDGSRPGSPSDDGSAASSRYALVSPDGARVETGTDHRVTCMSGQCDRAKKTYRRRPAVPPLPEQRRRGRRDAQFLRTCLRASRKLYRDPTRPTSSSRLSA